MIVGPEMLVAWKHSADLGDADEFEEGDEPLSSDDEDEDDNVDDA